MECGRGIEAGQNSKVKGGFITFNAAQPTPIDRFKNECCTKRRGKNSKNKTCLSKIISSKIKFLNII